MLLEAKGMTLTFLLFITLCSGHCATEQLCFLCLSLFINAEIKYSSHTMSESNKHLKNLSSIQHLLCIFSCNWRLAPSSNNSALVQLISLISFHSHLTTCLHISAWQGDYWLTSVHVSDWQCHCTDKLLESFPMLVKNFQNENHMNTIGILSDPSTHNEHDRAVL